MSIDITELIIPVYLNQRIVFDLIDMLQGGISTVTRVSASKSQLDKDQQQYSAKFGLNKSFSTLLKSTLQDVVKNSGSIIWTTKIRRAHTSAPMFQTLREILIDKGDLKIVDSEYKPNVRNFIESTAQLRKNPIVQTMYTLVGLMKMALLFNPHQIVKKQRKALRDK
ncbi:MAG: hypothetical protein PWR24_1580 [Desulfonauticus sp.]|jgi:hypothetical protein|nr:hypothetical protein [Desulfonauticus sp.]